jgi:hypothetical protein
MRIRRPVIPMSLGVLVASSLLAAGCGGGSPGVASVHSSTTAARAPQNQAVAYALCMRSHGVSNFPDPNSAGEFSADQLKSVRVADELSFASCMRSRGVSRFPDPTAQGDLSVAMVAAHGVDVHSAAVLRVVQACLPASHGALTPAKVRQALHEAGG